MFILIKSSDTSQLSMFDVLINEYRIVPLLTGDTVLIILL